MVTTAVRPWPLALDDDEILRRAHQITFLLTDCDGVLTDGTVYCSADGEELLRFSRRDGMGVERLRDAGITTAIVTRERSPIVAKRAAKLGIEVFAGVHDKKAWLAPWLIAHDLEARAVAYIGDDVNDLGIAGALAPHGLVGAPVDADPTMLSAAHFVSGRGGGAGAFREFADFVLALKARAAVERDPRELHGNRGGDKPWA